MKTEVQIPDFILETPNIKLLMFQPQSKFLYFLILLYKYIYTNKEYYFILDYINIKQFCFFSGLKKNSVEKYINFLLENNIFKKIEYKDKIYLTAEYLQLKYINYYRYINKNYSWEYYKIPDELLLLNENQIDKRKISNNNENYNNDNNDNNKTKLIINT